MQLPLEEIPIGVQHLEVTVEPAYPAELGETSDLLTRFDQQFLLPALLTRLAVTDQRVRDFTEGCLDRLLVARQRLLLCGLAVLDAGPDPSRVEDWRRCIRDERPGARRPREQVPQVLALRAKEPGQRDPWEVSSLRSSDACIGGDQTLFCR